MARGGRTSLASLANEVGENSPVDQMSAMPSRTAPLVDLTPNPRNPRDDLGDLSNLESIGDMQLQPAVVVTKGAYLKLYPDDRIGTRFVATTEAGAHPSYKEVIVGAGAGETEITGEFADCPLCATSPRGRVLRACIDSLHEVSEAVIGTASFGTATVDVTRGSGMPPGLTASGKVEAMAMYAGEGVAAITGIESAAAVVQRLWPEHDPVAL